MGINIFKGANNPLIKVSRQFTLSTGTMSRFEQIPGDIAFFKEISLADFDNAINLSVVMQSTINTSGFTYNWGVTIYHRIDGLYTLAGGAIGGNTNNDSSTYYASLFTCGGTGRILSVPNTSFGPPTTNQELFQNSTSGYAPISYTSQYQGNNNSTLICAPIKSDSILVATIQGGGLNGVPTNSYNLLLTSVY